MAKNKTVIGHQEGVVASGLVETLHAAATVRNSSAGHLSEADGTLWLRSVAAQHMPGQTQGSVQEYAWWEFLAITKR